jgi:hypothetical protein
MSWDTDLITNAEISEDAIVGWNQEQHPKRLAPEELAQSRT